MDRFRAPTLADELARCDRCNRLFHYTALNDEGVCIDCQNESEQTTTTEPTMKTLTSKNVEEIFLDCLFKDGEDTSTAKVVEGIVSKFGFNPQRLELHKTDIAEMLQGLPEQFHADKGGGWSFLQACMTKDGQQWGEHRNIEQLLCLGIATEQACLQFPREMWSIFPGVMPYFVVMPCPLPAALP